MASFPKLSTSEVEALAPDASSLKAARKLAVSSWSKLGQNQAALWGAYQGSGKNPYMTRVASASEGFAYKCSCPSRKFPCKHALALLLLWSTQPTHIKEAEAPDWVAQWLESRANRAASQPAKATSTEVRDPEAQAKRVAARERKIAAGLQELELWLHDMLRAGLMTLDTKSLETMAARLIDAQAKGLASRVRSLSGLRMSQPAEAAEVLLALAELQLLLDSYRQQAQLTDSLCADVRRLVGWNDDQHALMQQAGSRDRWLVLGQQHSREDTLRVQHTWLWGSRSQQVALLLQFAFGERAFAQQWRVGSSLEAELVFAPSCYPLRAYLKPEPEAPGLSWLPIHAEDVAALSGYPDAAALLTAYAEALGRYPWLQTFPCIVQEVQVTFDGDDALLENNQGAQLPLTAGFNTKSRDGWKLIALSGGHPISLVGLWDGRSLTPLAAYHVVDDALSLSILAKPEDGEAARFATSHDEGLSPSLARALHPLLTVALLGTQRKPVPDLMEELTDLQGGLATRPREVQLLYQALGLALRQRAGYLPQLAIQTSQQPVALPDTLPALSTRASQALAEVLRGVPSYRPHLLPALRQEMLSRGYRVPASLLPEVLNYAEERLEWEANAPPHLHALPDAEQQLKQWVGERGYWLAQQHPRWCWLMPPYDPASWQRACERFETGSLSQRTLSLRRLRRMDAEEARALLQASWSQEDAKQRTALLPCLGVGLSSADEAMLSTVLAEDGSRYARTEAERLLACLPDSAHVAALRERLAACVQVVGGRLQLTLPEHVPELSNIDAQVPRKVEPGAWWLQQLVARVPMASLWHDALEPSTLYPSLNKATKALLLPAWVLSCLRFLDQAQALALWQQAPAEPLLQPLSALFRDDYLAQAARLSLQAKPVLVPNHVLFSLMKHHPIPWDDALLHDVVTGFAQGIPRWLRSKSWRTPLSQMGYSLSPKAHPALLALQPKVAGTPLEADYQQMLVTLAQQAARLESIGQG